MSTSPYLKMTLLTVGQATPETTVNDALLRLENSNNRRLNITMSGGGINTVLTADQFTTYQYFKCNGLTGAGSLTIPLTVDGNLTAINRVFIVNNNGSFNLVITSTGGTDITLTGGGIGFFFCDGTDISTIMSTSIAGLTAVSGDSAPSLGGDLNTNAHNLTTTGDFAIVGSTATGGSASWRMSPSGGSITVSGTFNVIGTLNVSGGTNLGALTVSGTATILGATVLKSTLAVSGVATFNNTVNIVGTLNVSGGSNLGALTVSGNLTVATLTALQNVVTDGSKVLISEAAVYDISPFFGGKPSASGALMGYHLVGRNLSLASGAVGWIARARTPAADATKTVDIQKNGVSIGSIVFASGANTGTYTFNATTTFSAGDRIEFFGPATQDSALADLAFFIKGVRLLP